jgi:hypothetical protein
MSDQSSSFLGIGNLDRITVGSKGGRVDRLDIDSIFGSAEESKESGLAIRRYGERCTTMVRKTSPICGWKCISVSTTNRVFWRL